MRHADVCYFSGTGNTLFVLRSFLERVAFDDVTLTLHPIEKTDPATLDIEDSMILAFPVAYQSTYPFIWRFLKHLKNGHGQPVYMLDTLAGFSGGIVGPLKRLLKKRGYSPVGAKEIIMPSNLRFGEFSPEDVKEAIDTGRSKGIAFAEAVLKRNVSWPYYPVFEDSFYLMFLLVRLMLTPPFQTVLRFLFPRLISERCNSCGICVKMCPTGNIRMGEKAIHGKRCEICLRCVSFCPQTAVRILNRKNSHYHAVDLNTMLNSEEFLKAFNRED